MSELYGDWDKVEQFLDNLSNNYMKNIREVLERSVGKEIEIKLKDSVRKQLLTLEPLSPSYLQRKKAKGLDPRTLIATGEYINNLQVIELEETEDTLTLFIGATDEMHYSGLTFAELSVIIEYGTDTQPPRPHVALTWEKIQREVESKVQRLIKEELEKLL